MRVITEALPRNCGAAVALVMHVGRQPSQLPEILNWHGKLPAAFAEEGAILEPGHIYVAPPDRHMLLETPDASISTTARCFITPDRPSIPCSPPPRRPSASASSAWC